MLQGKLGEALISLCYQPTVGRITVVVMKCRDLKSKDINGYSGKCVKIIIWLSALLMKLFILPSNSRLHRLHLGNYQAEPFLYRLIVTLIHEAVISIIVSLKVTFNHTFRH